LGWFRKGAMCRNHVFDNEYINRANDVNVTIIKDTGYFNSIASWQHANPHVAAMNAGDLDI
jgi:hypothetical protein